MANNDKDKDIEGLEDNLTPSDASPEDKPEDEPTDSSPKDEEDKSTTDPLMVEKSRWGRRVANVERSLVDVMEKFNKFIELQEEKTLREDEEDLERSISNDSYLTKEDVDRLWEAKRKKEEREQNSYVKSYTDTVAKLGASLDDKVFDAIAKEMETTYNQKVSPDPEVAARLNFLSAKTAYYEKKLTKKEVPVKGKSDLPTDLSGFSQQKPHKEPLPQLTPEAREFLQQRGLDEEWAREALKE